jgi:hypothetical protein
MSNPLPPSTPITLDAKNPVVIYRIETDIVPKDAIVETSDVDVKGADPPGEWSSMTGLLMLLVWRNLNAG